MEVILDGEKTRVGMTDTIVLKNSNIRNRHWIIWRGKIRLKIGQIY